MDANDLERYKANLEWFNRFFMDVKQLLDKIVVYLPSEYTQPTSPFYYPKTRSIPSIPSYLFTALGGSNSVIQIYAVFDHEIIGDIEYFIPEPSLFIIKHSDKDSVLYAEGYGLNIIQNKTENFVQIEEGVISGRIPQNEGVSFQAFQVPLGQFTIDQNVEVIIQEKIVNVIHRLPNLSN